MNLFSGNRRTSRSFLRWNQCPIKGISPAAAEGDEGMAVNKPKGDNARKGAVKKRAQLKTKLGGASAWTKRSKKSGEFMGVKKPAKKAKAAKKFKGVRREKA